MALSDLAVVMNAGHIEQADHPRTVFSRPATAFVARFIGAHNVIALPGNGTVAVRSDRLLVSHAAAREPGLPARVAMVEYQGTYVQLRLEVPGRPDLIAVLADDVFDAAPLAEGDAVTVGWNEADAHPVRDTSMAAPVSVAEEAV